MAPARKCTLRIWQRPDGRYEIRNANPLAGPLGVDTSKNQAIGSALREAKRISKRDNCRVSIRFQNGRRWEEVDHVDPPSG
jgi:hypothetical protein